MATAVIVDRVGAEGRAAHPDVDLAPERLAARLASLEAPDDGALACADLFLACACVEGVPAALARFEASFIARIGQMLARAERDPLIIDEVRQRVRLRLLVGSGGDTPRLASYRGKGALDSWVRVVALREHLDLVRQRSGHAEVSPDLPDLALLSPELSAVRAQHRGVIEEALRAALGGLPGRERLILRMAYVDGMPLDAIGRVLGVHKATVSRWLAATREALLTEVVARVASRTGATAAEVQSLLRVISSEIELSLAGLLRSGAA